MKSLSRENQADITEAFNNFKIPWWFIKYWQYLYWKEKETQGRVFSFLF